MEFDIVKINPGCFIRSAETYPLFAFKREDTVGSIKYITFNPEEVYAGFMI